ncbi:MAG TPA: polysaccharide deacetylase family protein [Chitinophagaceae bacterium]|nr:polysaccharide deacetylase family protein [Chitinophagaceae bacterium]
MKILLFVISALLLTTYSGCDSTTQANPFYIAVTHPIDSAQTFPVNDATTILNRAQIPILCYHQIRDWSASDSKRAEDYIVPVNNFREQMKFLADNGYHTILPDQLYDYLLKGITLPSRPIVISFDDTRVEQYSVARDEMNKYGFKGVYFIMTVSLGRPGYMTKDQVKQLADEGNIIGSHTWNHSNVKHYSVQDWITQIDKPSQELEKITGKPIKYFAYPFGLWNKEAIEQLKQRGFKAAFQLSAKRDENYPQFTIRRIIVPGEWNTSTFQKWINHSF